MQPLLVEEKASIISFYNFSLYISAILGFASSEKKFSNIITLLGTATEKF